mmetsp:Transcript_41682/g.76324  ORF Transcript_41682/g.76324 Transcript_41682/m.76324 type:complete len:219 (+) Transcript_41682:228-884(+)
MLRLLVELRLGHLHSNPVVRPKAIVHQAHRAVSPRIRDTAIFKAFKVLWEASAAIDTNGPEVIVRKVIITKCYGCHAVDIAVLVTNGLGNVHCCPFLERNDACIEVRFTSSSHWVHVRASAQQSELIVRLHVVHPKSLTKQKAEKARHEDGSSQEHKPARIVVTEIHRRHELFLIQLPPDYNGLPSENNRHQKRARHSNVAQPWVHVADLEGVQPADH